MIAYILTYRLPLIYIEAVRKSTCTYTNISITINIVAVKQSTFFLSIKYRA